MMQMTCKIPAGDQIGKLQLAGYFPTYAVAVVHVRKGIHTKDWTLTIIKNRVVD